jgi:hypothetical protein
MKLFRRRGDRMMFLHRGQGAQLAHGQFPRKSARHRIHLYKKNFGRSKDKKISLILQTGLLWACGLPTGRPR